ncbi:unnamed protein product [Nyctereutes procyonoides]|uniref:(raccoon dog) hypothetical protein n=1 Tax=Nyctereutes procyonoides TaxID=34880 RepID=A0A811XYR3_NYCPR|nr:uncharacterized protein C11orf24 homolog [Nyctereutes procyonoides]CAD7669965.1 unnamed protein product [Nyctereutes procyonoides]
MWTALVLVWISFLSLSNSQVPTQDSRHLLPNQTDNPAKINASVMTVISILNGTSKTVTGVTPSPVTLAAGTPEANPSSPVVIAGRTLRTDTGTEGPPDPVTSSLPLPSALTSSAWQTLSSSTLISTSPMQVPRIASLTTPATSAQTAPGMTPGANGLTGTQGPSEHIPGNSPASLAPSLSPQALNESIQVSIIQTPTAWPMDGTASGPASTLFNTTSDPTRISMASVASVSTTAVTTTTTQAQELTTSTEPAPAPHTSPTPEVEVTSPTTQPSPAPLTRDATGPGTPGTPEQVPPETSPGTASTALTPGSSGGSKMPTTDSCSLSTQGQYLVVTTKPLSQSLVNRGFLLALLLLGVTLFIIILVLFALQAYESYRKKEYTQVDYLINGMYADSEL